MRYKSSIYNNIFEFDSEQYLYNAHSGFFCKIENEMLDYIKHIDHNSDAENNEVFPLLKRKGVIVSNELNEFNMIKLRTFSEQYSIDSQILSFVIATTRNCNYNCVYCFEGELHENLNMTEETQKAVADFITDSLKKRKNCKKLHITWFGGEPLLNYKCIEYISSNLIVFCESQNIEYNASVVTNGLLLSTSMMEKLIELKVNNVQISIDGDEEEYCAYKRATYHNFETVINNICSISETIKLSIRCNTDSKNYDSIKRVSKLIISRLPESSKRNVVFYLAPIEYSEKMSVSGETFNKIVFDYLQFLMDEKMFNSIKGNMPQPRYVSCGALKRGNYCIDSNGSLIKCEHYVGNDSKKCGDVFNGANYSPAEVDLCFLPINEKCEVCSYFPVCRGGCAQSRLDKNINVECDIFKEQIKTFLYYLSKGI